MRSSDRLFCLLALSLGVASCDNSVAPVQGRVWLTLAPAPGSSAAIVDRARISVIRPPADTIRDTTVTMGAAPITLSIVVTVPALSEQMNLAVTLFRNGVAAFHGGTTVSVFPLDQPAPPTAAIVLVPVASTARSGT